MTSLCVADFDGDGHDDHCPRRHYQARHLWSVLAIHRAYGPDRHDWAYRRCFHCRGAYGRHGHYGAYRTHWRRVFSRGPDGCDRRHGAYRPDWRCFVCCRSNGSNGQYWTYWAYGCCFYCYRAYG